MTTTMMMGGRGGDLQRRTGVLPDHQMPAACEFFTGGDQLVMPPGFRFHPFDDELIVHYLLKKAVGEALPFGLEDVIPTVRLFYGPDGEGDPRCLFQCLPQAARHHPLVQRADEFYIFTRWAHCNAGDRPTRVAGPGTWNFNHDRAVVDGRGRTIGRVAHLTFLLRDKDIGAGGKKRGKGATTHWVMHEYHLPDELEGEADGGGRRRGAKKGRRAATQQQQPCEGRLVLCRIRYTQKDKDNSGGVLDVDEGHISDGSPLHRPLKRRGVGGLAPEVAMVSRCIVPQHPVTVCYITFLDPPPPPQDHRLVRADVPNGPVEPCPTILDDDDVLPPAPAAPPAMPLYDRETAVQQFVCPPVPVAVVAAGQWPIDLSDAQRDHEGTPAPRAIILPHYAGEGEAPVPLQFMTPLAPVVDVRERCGFDPATSEGGGCGPCAGDDDWGAYMEQDLDGNWLINLGDLLPGQPPDCGDAARTEMCDTGHDDRLPTAPPAAPTKVCARDPPRLHVAAWVEEDVYHELPQIIDVGEPPEDLSLEYCWPPEPPDRPPDELTIPLQGAGGFPGKDLEASLWHNLCWSP